MSKHILIPLLCVSVLAGLYLLKRNYVLKQRYQKSLTIIKRLDESQKIYESRISQLTDMTSIDFSHFGNVAVKDTGNKEHRLKSLVAGGPKLIYRFTSDNYDSSYVSQFEKIKILADNIDDSNVVFLLSFPQADDLKRLREKFKLRFPMYNVQPSDLNKFLPGKYNLPYLFILDHNSEARFLFFPGKMIPNISAVYFQRISDFFDDYHLHGL
jgi:hypothetical protein